MSETQSVSEHAQKPLVFGKYSKKGSSTFGGLPALLFFVSTGYINILPLLQF